MAKPLRIGLIGNALVFSNHGLVKQQTWNDILAAMIQVRENHGWHA